LTALLRWLGIALLLAISSSCVKERWLIAPIGSNITDDVQFQ
jgi:hypothetical protein